jgi:formylglycine-generating enzyme required for sulfatase activity
VTFKLSSAPIAWFVAASFALVVVAASRRADLAAPPARSRPAIVIARSSPVFEPIASAAVSIAARPPACPESMVHVGDSCIDRYEARLVERRADGSFVPHSHLARPARGVVYEARSDAGVFPQAYVSRDEARDACVHADKRLCSMHEWRTACEGPARTIYPYGDKREAGACNTDKPHLLSLLFGYDPSRWHYEDFNDPRLNAEPGFLAKTGAFEHCADELGVHDLVGNVHEWVSDNVDRAFVERLERDGAPRSYQPWSSGNGVFMGGFFSTREEHGPGCAFTTIAHEPGYHDYSTGFRCCKDAVESPG